MNNTCFGKIVENVTKWASIGIITMDEQRQKLINRLKFRLKIIFSDNFSVAKMAKSKINQCQHVYIGFAALQLFRLYMKFFYEYMKPKHSEHICLFMWIWIALFVIFKLGIFLEDIKAYLQEKFDISNYKKITLVTSLQSIKRGKIRWRINYLEP